MTCRPRWRLAPLAAALLSLTLVSGCGVFKGGNRRAPVTVGERVPVPGFEQDADVSADVQGLDVVLPSPAVNADWTAPAGDASGAMGNLALAERPTKRWTVNIGSGSNRSRKLNATPVISANRLFVMDADARLSAYDATTARLLWRQTIRRAGEGDSPAYGGGVSVMGDRVFATSGFGLVTAFDAESGKQLWQASLPTPLRGAPAVDDGRVYATSEDGRLTALSADTGEELWEANASVEPATVMGPGAPAVALGTVVAGFPSGELFALRVENGRTVWQDVLTRSGRTTALGALSAIAASPVIDRDRVFAISHGGRMVAIDLASGQRIWEREIAGIGAPWPVGDWVFTLTLDSKLLAMTRTDGKVRWVRDLGHWKNAKAKKGPIQWYGPVLAGGQLLVVSSRGELAFVSPADGTIAARDKVGGSVHLPPVVANSVLYILADDGKLSAWR